MMNQLLVKNCIHSVRTDCSVLIREEVELKRFDLGIGGFNYHAPYGCAIC